MSAYLAELQPLQARGVPYRPLDPESPEIAALLEDVPGGIFSPHGRRHCELRFMRWDSAEAGRAWARAAGRWVTTAADQRAASRGFKASRGAVDGGPFVGVYLTARGFNDLNHPPLEPAVAPIGAGNDDAFFTGLTGMNRPGELSTRARRLGDQQTEWEPAYLTEMHAVLLVAFDGVETPPLLGEPTLGVAGATVVARDSGSRLTDKAGAVVEPFGHRDCIADLRFLGPPAFAPDAATHPLWQVLRETSPGRDGARRFGSFLVLRKMEQDVGGYHATLGKIAAQHFGGDTPAAREQASAWLVGRYFDGSPRELHERRPAKADPSDSFRFDSNPPLCPLHAHIRKMNPRDEVEAFREKGVPSRLRLPVRRSVAYDQRAADGGRKRGLLFMAFVADIQNQFEHLITEWANQSGFPFQDAGPDPLIGRTSADGLMSVVMPADPANPRHTPTYQLRHHVKTVGGVYLWAPPRSFLTTLSV